MVEPHRSHPGKGSGEGQHLLLVLPIVPWPVRRNGISLRFAPIVEYLRRHFELHLLILAEEPESCEGVDLLRGCESVTVVRVPVISLPAVVRRVRIASAALSPWGQPIGASRHFDQAALESEVVRYVEQSPCTTVLWAATHLTVACRVRRRFPNRRFVLDLVDSPALAVARTGLAGMPRPFARYTAWKWRRLERSAQDTFDAVIYISAVDACTARKHAPHVHVVPNGLSFGDAPAQLPKAGRQGALIGFLGDMSYGPNISATLRLAQRIFPLLRRSVPEANLLIIGRDPVPEIKALSGPQVKVTGTVEDIWSYVGQPDLFIFPMLEGVGLQNKILEAMYARVPVITTPLAAAGLGEAARSVLLIGATDGEIVAGALEILGEGAVSAQRAARAHDWVVRQFDWKSILPRYASVVAGAPAARAPT